MIPLITMPQGIPTNKGALPTQEKKKTYDPANYNAPKEKKKTYDPANYNAPRHSHQ